MVQTDTSVKSTADDLLALLEVFQQNGISVWLHGGWALEAVTGVARAHSDIDLLTHESNRGKLKQLFREKVSEETSHKLELKYGTVTVDLIFFEQVAGGRLVSWTPRIIAFWPPDLPAARNYGQIGGHEVPVVGLAALYMEIANTVRKKQPMLQKNKADLEILERVLTPEAREIGTRLFPRENTFWNRLRTRLGL